MIQPSLGVHVTTPPDEIQAYLKSTHKNLKLVSNCRIEGKIDFAMQMIHSGGYELLNPYIKYSDPKVVQDSYNIVIEFNGDIKEQPYPVVWETGDKIKGSLLHIKKRMPHINSLQDLHLYPSDESLCLCTFTHFEAKYKKGISIYELIEDLIIPFLYYQSYLSKYFREPYSGNSHGDLGLLEYLSDNRSSPNITELTIRFLSTKVLTLVLSKNPSSNRPCICGSGKTGKKCHRKAIIGAKIIYKRYRTPESLRKI